MSSNNPKGDFTQLGSETDTRPGKTEAPEGEAPSDGELAGLQDPWPRAQGHAHAHLILKTVGALLGPRSPELRHSHP